MTEPERTIIAGSPQECAERIIAYSADEVIITPFVRDDRATITRIGAELVSALRR